MTIEDINKMSGTEFEHLCAALLERLDFQVELTKASGDGGIDIIAYNNKLLYKGKYIVQCKRYSGSVGEPILRDLYGVITAERANKGILMTTGHFTAAAITFVEDKQIELIDGDAILSLMSQHGITENMEGIAEPITTVEKGFSALRIAVEKKEYMPEYNDIITEAVKISPNSMSLLAEGYANWIYTEDMHSNIGGPDWFWDDLYIDTHHDSVMNFIKETLNRISKLMFALTIITPYEEAELKKQIKESICQCIVDVTKYWILSKSRPYGSLGFLTVGLSADQKKPLILSFIQFVREVRQTDPTYFKNENGSVLPDPFDPPEIRAMGEGRKIQDRIDKKERWWTQIELGML